MIRSLFLFGAAAAALAAAPAGKAVDPSLGPPPARIAGYLTVQALDGETVIGPPPAADSPRGRADRTVYVETRSLAGTPRWALAARDNDIWNGGALERYSCALGAEVSPKTTPITYRLLQRVESDVRTVGTPAKDHYNRTRPLIGDDRPVCIAREPWMSTNASYPSGHAMVGWAWGLILGELAPARLSGLMAAGREVGESRVVCGVHYPSDVEAGRNLGAAMVARLHAEPAFLQDLAAAKAELAKTTAAPANCPV